MFINRKEVNMPNLCETVYKIAGKQEEVQSLFNLLTKLNNMKQPKVENGFGKLWLGCIVEELGEEWNKVACRGEVLDFNLSDDVLTIWQQTAWCEQAGFRHLLETKFPHIKVFYREEECGMDIYYTNDHTGHYFPEKYFLDSYDDPEYFMTLKDAINRVKKITGKSNITTEDDMLHALDLYMEDHVDEDIFYSMHKFTVGDD